MRVTRFPSRSGGLADRMADFVAHLRMNGFVVGTSECAAALASLAEIDATDASQARWALGAVLVADRDGWQNFDALFEAYWFNAGRQQQRRERSDNVRPQTSYPKLWQGRDDRLAEADTGSGNDARSPDEGVSEAEGVDGRLIATRTENLHKRDLREMIDKDSLAQAERSAQALARAIRDRRSRRRKRSQRGAALDMRRVMRASLARGGDPVELFRRKPPTRPIRIVAICDVSGSMTVYARVFLAFLKGLSDSSNKTESFLFHTRLLRVTDALRDHDTLRAAARLSLMAQGFGGGTDISGSLGQFMAGYGNTLLDRRTVVLILSDGYSTSSADELGDVLSRMRRKAGRIVWLNPLLGWQEYAPVASAISAAMPHLDAHLPANTLEALAALEPEFAKL